MKFKKNQKNSIINWLFNSLKVLELFAFFKFNLKNLKKQMWLKVGI